MSSEPTLSDKYRALDPDVRLMLQVKEDDAGAFEQLVSRYQDRVLTVMQHLLNNRDLAEDLSQDVFLRLFRARKNYHPRAKFSTYLFTIANNVARNARRTLARRKEVQIGSAGRASTEVPTLETMAKEASGLMPTRQFDRAESIEMLRIALDSLNERQRMAVLLSKFEGMSYQEIADTMEVSPQAIKSLLSRARGSLRDALRPYYRDGVLPAGGQEDDASDGSGKHPAKT